MVIHYHTILMNHLEHMQVDVVATSETLVYGTQSAEPIRHYECSRILLVTSGKGTLKTNQEQQRLEPGRCSIILAGKAHVLEADEGEILTYKWCHFRASFADREMYKLLRLPLVVSIPLWEEPAMLLDRISRYITSDIITAKVRMKAALLELISLYIEHLDAIPVDIGDISPEIDKIAIVLNFVDDHLAESITVEDLAKQVFLHPNYFIVFFKGVMGCSPIQYVNQRRMEVARDLLANKDCNVSDVAARIGMKIYYFSRMFKVHTGLSPSRYRKLAFEGKREGSGHAEKMDRASGEAVDKASPTPDGREEGNQT